MSDPGLHVYAEVLWSMYACFLHSYISIAGLTVKLLFASCLLQIY